MGLIGRTAFVEILSSAALGTILFTFVLFLNRVTKLFEQLVRGSAPPETVLYLFALLLPPALTFTIPVGVLAGTLLAMSRMSGDTEIVALRASGIPGRRLLIPVLAIGLIGTLLTGAASLWLTPLSVRQTFRTLNRIAAAQLTAEIQPRVFEEQFPNTVLYVGDVIPGPVVRWRNLFLADISPAEKRAAAGGGERGNSPRVTIASEAMVTSDVENNRLQLSLVNGSTHEPGRDPAQYYKTAFPRMEQALAAAARGELRPTRVVVDMDTGPLWRASRNSTDAAIE
ncbi:MAG TPA: LptF/LptG family permease, partial [Bryobacteraceae bacterium]|nr:LptF/LptG family permease [Bryobacteraceae bacterium]